MLATQKFTVHNNKKKKEGNFATNLTNWHFESLYLLIDFQKEIEIPKIQMKFVATEKTMMNF